MIRQNILRLSIAFGISAMTVVLSAPTGVTANAAHVHPLTPLTVTKGTGKLSYRLQALAQSPSLRAASAQAQATALSLPANGSGSLLKDDQGRLLVYIRTNDLSPQALRMFANAGASITHVSEAYKMVTAFVDAAHLNALAAIPSVISMREEFTPGQFSQPGSLDSRFPSTPVARPSAPQACNPTKSEGDTQLNAALARTNFGIDGTGVKVGILSDSFDRNTGATTHAAGDVLAGDLPGPGNPCGRLTAVNVISEMISTGGNDEGRAMAHIVHDLAPGAILAFASAFNGFFAFADNIRALRTAGANIIVDDIYYFAEPLYQDGPIGVAISDVVGSGALYFTSAGNHNRPLGINSVGSYESPAYRPIPCPAGLPPGSGATCHDFDPGAGTSNGYTITLANGGAIKLVLQWDEPWNGVTTDFDVYLLDNTNTVQAESFDDNINITQIPFETFSFPNLTGSAQTYRIVINRFSSTGTPRLKFFLDQSSHGITAIGFPTSSGGDIVGPTVNGHSATEFGLSVAAAPFNSNTTPETFSSRGPAAHYFGPVLDNTAAPAVPVRALQQPDFTATDGGCNTFFGSPPTISDPCFRFFGTSAAAPHAAAVAALIEQEANQVHLGLSQSTAKFILQSTARTMSGGNLNSVGAGLIDANAAVTKVTQMVHNTFVPIARQ